MKIMLIGSILILLSYNGLAQHYQIESVPLATRWVKEVSSVNALSEFPRPQMLRSTWQNLNGLWNYAITDSVTSPTTYGGQLLVPYPLESSISGVKKMLRPEQRLWYMRTFQYYSPSYHTTLLHFGAVDYQCWVYLNGRLIGEHEGGYTAFSFDITNALKPGDNELVVKVYDPSDAGVGPRGKQVLNPQGIYYTPSSGIWQTVWLETVPEKYISSLTITPDVDQSIVQVTVHAANNSTVTLEANGRTIKGKTNTVIRFPIENMRLWSPGDPYLYNLTVTMGKDKVSSYFGMRKISIQKDEKGTERIFLNNKPYFNLGTLDQGFWPDGLHTAPTDEALRFDIEAIKAMGFNTIRKHIKIEPARWYYHADRLGMLVWQDFVQPNPMLPPGSKEIFEKQGAAMMEQLYNHPCITTWVLFNEKWGQYDQQRLTEWVKQTDPTRLVNGHSGEILYVNEKLRSPSPNAYVSSDITDIHSYPDPMNAMPLPGKARVLGEFGGIGVFIPGHQWNTGSAWGYVNEKPAALKAKYRIMNQHLQLLKEEGLSGSIYTQPFDVEGEQNGLMTYDREVIKIPFAELQKIHAPLNPDMGSLPTVTAKNADTTEPGAIYADMLKQYINGKNDPAFIQQLAMYAAQTGDAAGRNRFNALYIASLTAPYSADDLAFIEAATRKPTDPGFAILLQQLEQNPDRSQHVKLMNMLYQDVIAPYVPNAQAKPDWGEVEERIKKYSTPGEEIFLRAKTIHTYNQQDWEQYVPTATRYIEKYGIYLNAEELKVFKTAIIEHQP